MILLDTHALIWLLSDTNRLSAKAKAEIEEARGRAEAMAVVDITLLELASLFRRGRMQLGMTFKELLDIVEARFQILPISGKASARTLELPSDYPKDPADRIIGATAWVEGIPLVTADERIRKAKAFATIW